MDKLLISFSGGLTSAYMTKWCIDNLSGDYEIIVVFANTGKEREETLKFVNDCDIHFGFNTTWVEAVTNMQYRKGVSAKVVDYGSASRNGEPFEAMIKKHGIPNVKNPFCTRELKERAIKAYARSIGWKKYYTAIGIRVDEIDRISPSAKEKMFIYPLVSMTPAAKKDIFDFWDKQDFRLKLKSYEGNCDFCFKKSFRKLMTLSIESPETMQWWAKMEEKYEDYIPKTRNQNTPKPIRFFRQNKSIQDIVEMAKIDFDMAVDESRYKPQYRQGVLFELDVSNGCTESCEVF